MKKNFYLLLLICLVALSCKDKKKEEQAAKAAEEKIVRAIDSTTNAIDNVKTDINQTAKELDNLLETIAE